MPEVPVRISFVGAVAVITMDDGKVNALNGQMLDRLWAALDEAEARAEAVVLAGRAGVFSGGLDLRVLRAAGDEAWVLVHRATDLCLRLVEFPRPVVAACTGHAVALGAVLLLCSDLRLCAAGDFKIGFNEVSIGLPVPELVVGLARQRLSRRHLMQACNSAKIYTPHEAIDVGFLDEANILHVEGDATRAAAELARHVEPEAFAATRRVMTARLGETIIRQAGSFMNLRDTQPQIRRVEDRPIG